MGSLRQLLHYLNHRPYLFQSLQTGVIMGLGDTLAQTVLMDHKGEKISFDYRRLICFSAIGFFFVGPIVSRWYTFLDKAVPIDKSGPPLTRGLKKMALDQLVFVPPMIPSVICLREVLRTGHVEDAVHEVRTKYFEILRANYMVWPAFQLINFVLVPLPYRVLATQLAGLGWNAFLSKVLSSHD